MSTEGRAPLGPRQLLVRILLVFALGALLVRLVGFAAVFVQDSVQMDFAAFHTAGRSVARGFSPYDNLVETHPELWDGVAYFRHSRFVYPPLAAHLFRPLALLSYPWAKAVWTAGSLLALAAAFVVTGRMTKLRLTFEQWMLLGIVWAGSYPVLTLLERGQIDAGTLLLISVALLWIERERPLVGGATLAAAALLKPTLAWMLVFLLVDRRWRACTGFIAGAVLLLAVGVALDGPAEYVQFAREELPRIGTYGEGGTRAMRLPAKGLEGDMRAGQATIDGWTYFKSSFRFVLNATPVQSRWARGLPISLPMLSAIVIGCSALLVWVWRRSFGPPPSLLLYGQLTLALALLAGPVSWAMTVVWLLPSAFLLMHEATGLKNRGHAIAVAVGVIGLTLAVMPDPWANAALVPFGLGSLDQKYIAAELLLAGTMLALWYSRHSSHGAAVPEGAAAPSSETTGQNSQLR